jgi:hypothetical protein
MKLEYVAEKAIFLAPKVYACAFLDGSTLIKVKGSKSHINKAITFEDFEKLLFKGATYKTGTQEKFYRSMSEGTISVTDILYTLKVSENKRALIYQDAKFVNTKPLILQE